MTTGEKATEGSFKDYVGWAKFLAGLPVDGVVILPNGKWAPAELLLNSNSWDAVRGKAMRMFDH